MPHHTTTKGDIGQAMAIADLLAKGYDVFPALSATSPFDLIAYQPGVFLRTQVKYREAYRGTLEVRLRRSSISNSRVVHVPNTEVDLVCIYSPETNRCYYVLPSDCPISLRVAPIKGGPKTVSRMAHDFLQIPKSRGLPHG